MPPFPLESVQRLETFHFRDDDVLISAYPKSGEEGEGRERKREGGRDRGREGGREREITERERERGGRDRERLRETEAETDRQTDIILATGF